MGWVTGRFGLFGVDKATSPLGSILLVFVYNNQTQEDMKNKILYVFVCIKPKMILNILPLSRF